MSLQTVNLEGWSVLKYKKTSLTLTCANLYNVIVADLCDIVAGVC